MAALSLRIDPDLERMLEIETQRRNTTKSKLVQEVLRKALTPKDPLTLLDEVRERFGINEAAKNAPMTNRASHTKELARAAVLKKHQRKNGDENIEIKISSNTQSGAE